MQNPGPSGEMEEPETSSIYWSYLVVKTKYQLLGFSSHYIPIYHMHINIIQRNKTPKNTEGETAEIIQEDISYARKPKLFGMPFKSVL